MLQTCLPLLTKCIRDHCLKYIKIDFAKVWLKYALRILGLENNFLFVFVFKCCMCIFTIWTFDMIFMYFIMVQEALFYNRISIFVI